MPKLASFPINGGYLLSRGESPSIIGLGVFHFRVRDGIGWNNPSIAPINWKRWILIASQEPSPISSAPLNPLRGFQVRPIKVVVSDLAQGDLILGWASSLDAFSSYPVPTWLLGCAAGATTHTPEVG